MQAGAIQPGQNVVIIDDLIATGGQRVCVSAESPFSPRSPGGSAAAAGELVAKEGGKTVDYLFIIELALPNARSKLDAPTYSVIQVDD
jgi:adenine phosphoribosyltransferase